MILVVDDDEDVRRFAAVALSAAGYRVREASCCREALDVCSESHPHLLLTDICMPDMNGVALASEMRLSQPGLRIVYMTGFSDRKMEPGSKVLQKPFTFEELKRVVESALS